MIENNQTELQILRQKVKLEKVKKKHSTGFKFQRNYNSPADNKQHNADADVREDHTDPDLFRERIQKAEHSWFLLHWFLDHDADAE